MSEERRAVLALAEQDPAWQAAHTEYMRLIDGPRDCEMTADEWQGAVTQQIFAMWRVEKQLEEDMP